MWRNASKTDKKIGIATVYRFLKKEVKNNRLHSYICNRKKIYSTNEQGHSHFVCEKCGKVEHIKMDSLEFLKNKIKGEICHIQMDITGICEKCKDKSETN